MFGIEFYEIIYFSIQLGLSMAGAAALWGLVLTYCGASDGHNDTCIIFDWGAEKLLIVLYTGIFIAGGAWLIAIGAIPVHAHVGIVLVPEMAERLAALSLIGPLFALWLLASPIGLFVRQFKPEKFHRRLRLFYAVQLLFTGMLISFPAWSGDFDLRQLFFFTHSFHSIMTLGTVIVLDFLFLLSKSSLHLRQHIYSLFPTISKVVLAGLAFEIVGVLFVFDAAIDVTAKFLFMQTVIGILLINGMILAGPLTRRMLDAVSHSESGLARRWEVVGDIAGTVSITSWFTITLVDFFENLTLSYPELFGVYAGVLMFAILVHLAWNYGLGITMPRWYFAWHRGS